MCWEHQDVHLVNSGFSAPSGAACQPPKIASSGRERVEDNKMAGVLSDPVPGWVDLNKAPASGFSPAKRNDNSIS